MKASYPWSTDPVELECGQSIMLFSLPLHETDVRWMGAVDRSMKGSLHQDTQCHVYIRSGKD